MRKLLSRRPTPAFVLALVAFVAAVSGPAVARKLITSKDIANGTINVRDLSPAARRALTRPPAAYAAGDGSSPTSTTPLKKSVPAGRYFVVAKAVLSGVSGNFLTRCDLEGGTRHDIAFGSLGPLGTPHSQDTVVATMITRFDSPGKLSWSCNPAGGKVSQAAINAVAVGTIH